MGIISVICMIGGDAWGWPKQTHTHVPTFLTLLSSFNWFGSVFCYLKLQGVYPGYFIFFAQSALMIAGSRGTLNSLVLFYYEAVYNSVVKGYCMHQVFFWLKHMECLLWDPRDIIFSLYFHVKVFRDFYRKIQLILIDYQLVIDFF